MRTKRILSLVLALIMVLSLCPTSVFATETTEPAAEYSYVFNSPAHNIQDDQRTLSSGYHTIEATVTSVSSGRWGFYGIKTGTGYSTTGDYAQWSSNIGTNPPVEGGSIIVFELEVPDGGVFKPTYNYTAGEHASKVDLYLVKAPETTTGAAGALELAKADENAYLGQVDCFEGESATFDNVELSDGNYLLVIAPNGANEKWTALSDKYNYLYMDGFNLKREKVYTPVKHSFVFRNSVYDPNTLPIPRATLATYKMANIIEGSSDAWEYADSRYLTDTRLGSLDYTGRQFKGLYWHSYTVRATSSAAVMTVALDVKAAGSYIPKLNYYAFDSSSIVDIYLAPRSVTGELTGTSSLSGNGSYNSMGFINGLSEADKAKYYLGQYDMYNVTAGEQSITFDERLFETEETYYLIFHHVGLNAAHTPMTSGSNTYIEHVITSLDLEPVVEEEEAVEQEYVTTIASLSSKLPSTASSAATEIGIQSGTTLRNWTLADWRTEAEDSDGGIYNTLDTSKTDPYAIDIGTTKPTRIYGLYMTAEGLQANFQEGYHNNRTGANRTYLALRLDVPAGGKYTLSMKSDNRTTGNGSFDVHFVEAQDGAMDTTMADSVLGTTSPRAPDGYYDFSPSGGENGVYYGVKTSTGDDLVVDVAPGGGEYWVVFYWNQNAIDRIPFTDDAKTEFQAIWLSGIKLTPYVEDEGGEAPAPTDELSGIEVLASATTLEVSAKANLSTMGTYTVSGEKEITSGVTYTSDNTAVATVSGNTVTAVAEGTAKITAAYGGKTSDITITVVDNSPAVATNTYEYKMTFDVLNSENMATSSTNYSSGDYLRNAFGGALYNKTKMSTKAQFAIDKDGNACEPYDVFKRSETADWEWASSYINTFAITKDHNALYGQFQVGRYGNTSSGFYVMLRLNVPEGGKYTLSYDGNRGAGYCAPAIYFAKDDGSALSADKNKDYSKFINGFVGYANFADSTKTGYVNVGTVEVAKGGGDYYLAIFPTSESKIKSPTSESAQNFYLRGIKLTPFVEGDDANDLVSIDAAIPEYELEIDTTADISVVADYSRTGKEAMTSGVTFVSDKPEVVAVEGAKITAKSAGTATITATVDGTQITDSFTVEVLAPDEGNAGVIREYKTTWDALQLDKLPQTNDSGLYGSKPYTRGGSLFQNLSLMNRDAVSNLNSKAEEVEPWRLMDFNITAPWDVAYQYSPGGVRIQKATNDLFLNYPVASYGASSGTILALRVEVPHKGIYNLAFDSNNVAHGINPAVYFFRDDGTLKSAGDIYSHIAANEEPVGYYSFSDTAQKGYKKLAEVEAPRQGEYFIVFYGDAQSKTLNPTVTTASGKDYQHLYLKGIRLSALPGALANVDVSVETLRTEADPMPLYTEKQISYSISDALGVPIDEIDEAKLTVEYDSSNKDVAEVSDSGLISALSNGATEISVKVSYDGAEATGKWKLTVAPASRNLAEHLNPNFDTDEWIWTGANNEPNPPAEPKFIRSYIATEEDGNRALKFEFNPEKGAAGATVFFKNDGHRVEVKPGGFYQLTFKFKTDYVVPSGASDFNMYFDIYAYNNPTGASSSSIAYNSARSMDLAQHAEFRELYDDWYEVVVPLAAPTEYASDVVYITPRLVMRPTSGDTGKLGYSGSAWFDDFELREVGYAGVEVSLSGAATAGQTLQVLSKPYTTLGHYISLGGGWGTDEAKLSCTDENVISAFTNLALASDGMGTNWLSAAATMGGKNATAEIISAITINGITREGRAEVATSGFAMQLLYAEAQIEPDTVQAGGSAKIVPTGYMSDGSVADMSAGNISYKSLTPDIVEVDENGNITAKRAGEGLVQANLLLENAGASATAKVKVIDSTPIESAVLAECATVGYLRDEQLIITGMMESGFAADISAADIEWIIESDPAGGVSVDENNLVFGEIYGAKATVYAKVTLNGATVETNAIEIEVIETDLRDHTIRFIDAHPTKPKNVTIEEYGWEIDQSLTHSSAMSGYFNTQGFVVTTNADGRAITIDVDVPYTGVYQIVFRGNFNSYNTLLGDIFADGTFVGDFAYYSGGRNATAEPESMRSIYLTAGKHTFTFRAGASGGRNCYQMLYELRLKARADMPEIVDIITDRNDYGLVIGDEAKLNAKMITADGFTYEWQTMLDGSADKLASVTYESSDESVASVDENGVIKALKAGETTVKVKAVSDKWSFEKDVTVTVDGSDINVATLATDRRTFYVTEQVSLGVNATLASGAALDPSKMTVTWSSSDESVVSFDETGVMTANAVGTATVKATIAYYNEPPFETTAEITVEQDGFSAVEISADSFVLAPNGDTAALTASGKTFLGGDIDITGTTVEWSSDNADVASVDENGLVTSGDEGSANITATVTLGGETLSGEAVISVRAGKTGRTYYTDEMVAAAQENTQKYDWAISLRKSAIKRADQYLDEMDFLYEMIPGEGIPRSSSVGLRNDPEVWYCRYCGTYLYDKYGHYPYSVNVLADPWKVQCQNCKRKFPSNDFAKLYELGRDEHGIYSIQLAEERNAELVKETNGEVDYMKNILYPELYDISKASYNKDPKSGVAIDGEHWGVDTGMGYDTGRTYSNGIKEIHTYLAYVMHCGIWYDGVGAGNTGIINRAINDLAEAYMYTGDIKYGRVGAVLVDRIADVYPGYDLRPFLTRYANSDGGAKRGKIIGSIWETYLGQDFIAAYDAFFPAYDDPQVVQYLSEKAEKFNLDNDKSTPEKIRQNIEDGILRETYDAVSSAMSMGNTGMHQNSCAMAAVVLDTHPDTDEMIDWIFKYSESDSATYNTGGGINQALVSSVGRDGQATESAFGYNRIWVTQLTDVANTLARYDEYDGMSLYEHPKYVGMIQSYPYVTLVRRGVPAIGDGGGAASYPVLPDNDSVMIDSFKYLRDTKPEIAREIAQHMYFVKGSDLDNLHYDVFTKNPESLKSEVEAIIDEYGEWDYDKSSMLTGYGLGILRSGTLYDSVGTNVIRDTQRDFWIYFGGATSHDNNDQLSLGIEAYGIGMTTDLGYPEATGHDPNRAQWMSPTISHNAVVVNEQSQTRSAYSQVPLHYDAKDTRVKVLDVDGTPSYTATDEYRRTIVMVDYDSDVSYGIDFFKVLGGDDHLYSFHANTDVQPTTSENLKFEQQTGGSYAGANVPFGNDPWTNVGNNYTLLQYPVGYTWLFDIHRADNPGASDFWIDYEIQDFRKLSRNPGMNIHLRMTMVNDFVVDEVTLANGMPPRTPSNLAVMDHLEYMLVRRKGKDLNTLFTTVIEPYNKERYIESIESVPVTAVDGTPGEFDSAKAVRVKLVDGRTDYVVYAQNNEVTYNVDGLFDFRGFVGVWTVNENGDNIYSYVNDGEMIGNDEEKTEGLESAFEGTVVDFQKELSFDNWIDVRFDRDVTEEEVADFADRMIVIDRDTLGNSSFVIYGAEKTGDNTARLDLKGVTAIDKYIDKTNESLGYVYDIEEGKHFTIPMSYEDNQVPVFDEVSENLSTSAGSMIEVKINATADDGGTITYVARQLPRGASFDAETGTISWKPSSSQLGEHLFGIDATDENGRTSTMYFTVMVYGSTTGGGGGGGAGSSGSSGTSGQGSEVSTGATTPSDDKEDATTPDTPSTDSGSTGAGADTNVRFIDLGNHAWAEAAINSLADEGIVKGTTYNTYSPASNITRADFALLLVRAFELTSENTENFDDVAATDYFATELAIARNTGIVQGIGNNLYAPRNTITRQDMMTITYRALTSLEKITVGEDALIAPDYPDFDSVAPYAAEAVKALITSGLVNGKSGKIAPTDYTTRAEVAVLLKRILDYTAK